MQKKVIKSQWPVEEGALIVAGRRFFQLFFVLALRNPYQSFSFGFKVVISLIFYRSDQTLVVLHPKYYLNMENHCYG